MYYGNYNNIDNNTNNNSEESDEQSDQPSLFANLKNNFFSEVV